MSAKVTPLIASLVRTYYCGANKELMRLARVPAGTSMAPTRFTSGALITRNNFDALDGGFPRPRRSITSGRGSRVELWPCCNTQHFLCGSSAGARISAQAERTLTFANDSQNFKPRPPSGAFSFKELAICHSRVIRHSERFAANLRLPSTSAPAAQSGLLLPAPQKERPAEAGQQVRICIQAVSGPTTNKLRPKQIRRKRQGQGFERGPSARH